MADALDSGSSGSNPVRVQVPFSAFIIFIEKPKTPVFSAFFFFQKLKMGQKWGNPFHSVFSALNRKIDESYNIDTLAMFYSTGYTSQGGLNLSEYKYLIFNICANKNKEDRTLGTTIIIPSSIVFDSSYTHEVKYDTTYTGVVYFTGSLGNATAIGKCSNASYGSAFLYGVK